MIDKKKTREELVVELEKQQHLLEALKVKLRESDSRYKSTIDAQNEGIVYQLADGTIQDCNKSAERILGLTTDQMMGRTSADPRWRSIHEDGSPFPSETHPTVQTLKTGEPTANVIMGIHQPDGELRWISINCNPLFHAGEDVPYAALASFRDITEQRKTQAQLLHAQKTESMGVLACGIAHEFNNVLSPIIGYTEMLLEQASGKQKDYLGRIFNASERARELVTQILSFSRKSSSERKPLQLKPTIEEALKLIKHTLPATIAIEEELDADIPPILASSHEMHQVVVNLCINAGQAMPEGGRLRISLKNGMGGTGESFFGKRIDGPFIVLCVEDTGCGIEGVKIQRIFDPFYTTKKLNEGTGLGLSIVLGIVEQHGGHISVNSSLGKGALFEVCIPALIDKHEISPKPQSLLRLQGEERILLVDDEEMLVDVAAQMLAKLGYRVTSFTSAEEALQWFDNHSCDIDLVITDYAMPQMNGRALADKLREVRSKIPIIVCTGYSSAVTQENIQLWGIDALLMKPYRQEEIGSAIRRVLDKNLP